MSTTPKPLHVMTSEYAGAVRVQLEAIGRVLEPFDQAAAEAGDMLVLRMIARVAEAVQAAEEIEQTRRALPTLPQRRRRGVRLAKR